MADPQPDRPPVDPSERPGAGILTQALVLAIILILTLAQEKVKEVFQQNPIYGLTPPNTRGDKALVRR